MSTASHQNLPKLVAIVGTNASGKSSLGLHLARKFKAEIVSADSRQVYRGLDIGTGKVTAEERADVPHHLIDIVDVGDPFSVAEYQKLAYHSIDGILNRRRLPLLVGGTGLYLHAVIDGYRLIEVPPDPALRSELEGQPVERLAQTLQEVDPIAASHIDLNNPRRIIRALEIHQAGYTYASTRQRNPRYRVLQLGVTWPRETLRERIDQRLARRLRAGMLEEVERLLEEGVSEHTLDNLGLEYRYELMYIKGQYATEEDFFNALRFAIHRFARRQMSWFKRDTRIEWLDTHDDYYQEAESKIEAFLSGTQ